MHFAFSSQLAIQASAAMLLFAQVATAAIDIGWTPTTPRSMMYARLDPLISPGKVSAHTHMFFGPNNIQPDANFASLRQSNCSTLGLGDADYSAYWVPAMYHIDKDGKYTLMKLKGSEIYYGFAHNKQDTPFPEDFHMIVGNPMAPNMTCKHGTPTSPTCNWIAAYYYCIDSDQPAGGYGLLGSMPRMRCNDRIGYHITFPQCWDGVPFTIETQDQHLVYGPTQLLCPAGYKRIPQIMFDFWFDTTGLTVNDASTDTYTLAYGGEKGMGLHGDFLNGWDKSVMQTVINDCTAQYFTAGSNDPLLCPILKQKSAEQAARLKAIGREKCLFSGEIPQENVGRDNNRTAIAALPGCNPMHVNNGVMPTCKTTCTPPIGKVGSFDTYWLPMPATETCAAAAAASTTKTSKTTSRMTTTSRKTTKTTSKPKTSTATTTSTSRASLKTDGIRQPLQTKSS